MACASRLLFALHLSFDRWFSYVNWFRELVNRTFFLRPFSESTIKRDPQNSLLMGSGIPKNRPIRDARNGVETGVIRAAGVHLPIPMVHSSISTMMHLVHFLGDGYRPDLAGCTCTFFGCGIPTRPCWMRMHLFWVRDTDQTLLDAHAPFWPRARPGHPGARTASFS